MISQSVRYDVIKTKKVTLDFLSRNDASSVPKIPQIGDESITLGLGLDFARNCVNEFRVQLNVIQYISYYSNNFRMYKLDDPCYSWPLKRF